MASPDLSSSSPPSPFQRKKVALAERVEWNTWRAWFGREWKQDEHISIIGPTGTGKSALAVDLLSIRSYVVYVFTKPADEKLTNALVNRKYVVVPAFPREPPEEVDRYLMWPPGSGEITTEANDQQRNIIRDAFQKIFKGPPQGLPGRWCVCLDEARYVSDPSYLGLQREVKHLLIQGRSVRLSMVLTYQRPAWVPAEAYDQASHLFIANDNDRRNVQRFREIGGIDGDRVAATVQSLKLYEWLHVDARPGQGALKIIRMPKGL